MSVEKLPEGWVLSKFTELMDVQGGTQPPKSEFIAEEKEGYIRLLQIRDFGKKPVPTYIPETKKLKTCREEDLLIGRYGASLGRICTGHEGAYNVALAKVIFPQEFERSYIRYYLESEIFQFPLRLLSRSAQNGFNKEDLGRFDFLLVPLAEQKIIAEKLDTLLAQVDSTKARLEQIPKILKRFRQAVLASAVNGILTKEYRSNEIFGAQISLGELILNGPQNGLYKPSRFYGDGIKIIRIDSFYDGKIVNFNELKRLDVTDIEKNKWLLQENDILINRVNSIEYLGKCAHVKNLSEEAVFESNIMRFSIDTMMISPEYLILFLCSTAGIKELRKNAKLAVNQASINQTDIKNCKLTLPALAEQNEIVRRVEQLFAYADTIEKQVNNALVRVNNLTQSILAKAFRGELTAQWRAENPELISGENSAAALLENIKTERAASTGKKASRKKS